MMRENDIDIVEMLIENMPEETELQIRIKLYMQLHKSNCNHYIYDNYTREAMLLNTIIKSLRADLGAEIARTIK